MVGVSRLKDHSKTKYFLKPKEMSHDSTKYDFNMQCVVGLGCSLRKMKYNFNEKWKFIKNDFHLSYFLRWLSKKLPLKSWYFKTFSPHQKWLSSWQFRRHSYHVSSCGEQKGTIDASVLHRHLIIISLRELSLVNECTTAIAIKITITITRLRWMVSGRGIV